MKLVDRQVTRELIGPFVFGLASFSSVFFVYAFLFKLQNVNGISLSTGIQLVLLPLPGILGFTLPMAMLLAVLIGIGRLSGDSEMVALFAGGVSLYRIALPVFVLALILAGATMIMGEYLTPLATNRYERMMADLLHEAKPTDQPFSVHDSGTNSNIMVNGGMDPATGILKDVTVTQFAGKKPVVVLYAKRAEWPGVSSEHKYRWRLYDGFWQTVGTDSPAMSTFEQSRTKEIDIKTTPDEFAVFQKSLRKKSEQMSFAEMSRLVEHLKAYPERPIEDVRKLDVDRWGKLAMPLSGLVFALLATPLGLRRTRSGASVGFGLSILVIFLYWMIWRYAAAMATQGTITPIAGAFTADAIGLAAAFILLRSAAK
jgi:lipopolysaccharide export system permease protein